MSTPEKVTTRALVVWAAAVAVYIAAVTGRTSMGVAGTAAIDHFGFDASRLAVFTSVQVGVYALAQIPTGVAVDRFGPRKLLFVGSVIMATGQIILGLTSSYGVAIAARVLIGAGDATAFLSVMRILPAWFPLRKTPVFTQLTAALGQLGQFLSAVPFMAMLHAQGWTPAFVSLGTSIAVLAVVTGLLIADAPHAPLHTPGADLPLRSKLGLVVRTPVCWEGFFSHWIGLMPNLMFLLLWGVPLITLGLGLSPAYAGAALVVNSVVQVFVSPIHGFISSRLGPQRVWAVITGAFIVAGTAGWFFTHKSSVMVLSLVLGVMSLLSNYGFDMVRENIDRRVLATGTGLANMGGFVSGMITAQAFGVLLDVSARKAGHPGIYRWEDFQVASWSIAMMLGLGLVGLVTSRVLSRYR